MVIEAVKMRARGTQESEGGGWLEDRMKGVNHTAACRLFSRS